MLYQLYLKIKIYTFTHIENNTRTYGTEPNKVYFNELKGKYSQGFRYYRKFSVADLLEIAMNEFIRDNGLS